MKIGDGSSLDSSKYYTQSLNLAAFLRYKKFNIIDYRKENGITTFFFPRTEEIFDAVREYNQRNDLKDFIVCFKEIKELAHK